jgi:hypothetical protein
LIEDVARYRMHYDRLLEEDKNLASFGVFDTSVITLPQLKDDQVVFYVEEKATGLPFKVEGPFPYVNPLKPFSYGILPFKQ